MCDVFGDINFDVIICILKYGVCYLCIKMF